MGLTSTVWASWRRFLREPESQNRQRLMELLCDEYVRGTKDVAQFQQHADKMAYPQFRKRLLQIAAEEESHVEWLRNKIRALGGEPPEVMTPVAEGKNSWECLLADAEDEGRDSAAVYGSIYTLADEPDLGIAEGLRRMYQDETRHRQEILDMLMKSDPQAKLS
jgi:rubrerythrin